MCCAPPWPAWRLPTPRVTPMHTKQFSPHTRQPRMAHRRQNYTNYTCANCISEPTVLLLLNIIHPTTGISNTQILKYTNTQIQLMNIGDRLVLEGGEPGKTWKWSITRPLQTALSSYLPYLPTFIPTYLQTYLPTYQTTANCLGSYLGRALPYLPIFLPAYLQTYLPTFIPTYLTAWIPTYLPTHLNYSGTSIPRGELLLVMRWWKYVFLLELLGRGSCR